jgi:hypothetical protein
MHTGNTQVGIEITEAVPEWFAALCAFAEKEFPGHWVPVEQFPWDAKALNKKEMRALLKNARTAGGWIDYAPEKKWASCMNAVVKNKLDKLANADFQKFKENWLSVYDNIPVRPRINLAEAIELLRPMLASLWTAVPAFDALFIEHRHEIVKITANGSEHFVINDLWHS